MKIKIDKVNEEITIVLNKNNKIKINELLDE
jgi:hypothetical protein